VAYSEAVYEALMDQVWGLIECAELIRESNAGYVVKDNEDNPVLDGQGHEVIERTHIRIGNNVLLHGENGTGKTLAAMITGQYCLEHGWTFVEPVREPDRHEAAAR
jgi:hypothetical protein